MDVTRVKIRYEKKNKESENYLLAIRKEISKVTLGDLYKLIEFDNVFGDGLYNLRAFIVNDVRWKRLTILNDDNMLLKIEPNDSAILVHIIDGSIKDFGVSDVLEHRMNAITLD